MSEQEAIERAQSGDPEAFSILYQKHHPRVRAHCRKMMHNAEDAEDVTQEVFLAVWKKIPCFQRKSSFSTWLFRLTCNLCLDRIRTRKSRIPEASGFPDNEEYAPPEPRSPENTQLRLELEQLFHRLTPQQQALIELDLEGYNSIDLSTAAGWKAGATGNRRLREAYGVLRSELTAV